METRSRDSSSPARARTPLIGALCALAVTIAVTLAACSNSAWDDDSSINHAQNDSSSDCAWDYSSSSDSAHGDGGELDYLPLDDTEYPYAGLPRLVIQTENSRDIGDRVNEIPAKLQIWGESAPESKVMQLTIRGRGNTSWETMPKRSYKIEFLEKQEILGMHEDKDWALVGNYADKTLMKNYLMYDLAARLGVRYAPQCRFVELYLNRNYLGVYLIAETIKVAEYRVNIPKTSNSYLVEITTPPDSLNKTLVVHHPKDISEKSWNDLTEHVDQFEKFLDTLRMYETSDLHEWLDIEECTKHYWVQEFSKNPDAMGIASLFFTWVKGSQIRMGPVWDFDLSCGGHTVDSVVLTNKWYIRQGYWHSYIFRDSAASISRVRFWRGNKEKFTAAIDTVDSLYARLQPAAKNNYKKWNTLRSTEYRYHRHAYDSYEEAVEDLKMWLRERYEWIDEEMSESKRAN